VIRFLSLLLLAAPAAAAAAPSRLDALLSRGATLTRAADPACGEPLETAAREAERSDADYARALAVLGLCREVQGRFADAHGLVSRALESAPAETTPAGRKTPWPALRAALRRLDDRVARVLVTWEDGCELYVDGHPAGGVSGRVMAVDPGRRLFEARREGRAIAAQEVEARAGDLPAVHLKAPESREKKAVTAAVTPYVPRNSLSPSPLVPSLTPRGLAVGTVYTAGAVALVAGILTGVFEAQRVSLRSGLPDDACPRPDASPRCAELRQMFEQRNGARTVAAVAVGVAVAAGGVAVGLHFSAERARTAGMVTVQGSW
jgi:hypothetical protein